MNGCLTWLFWCLRYFNDPVSGVWVTDIFYRGNCVFAGGGIGFLITFSMTGAISQDGERCLSFSVG